MPVGLCLLLAATNAARAAGLNGKARTVADVVHDSVSKQVQDTANRIDSFFGEERIDEESTGNRVRVRASLEVAEGGDLSAKLNVHAKLSLPRMKDRFRVVIGTDDYDDDGRFVEKIEDADYSSALRYIVTATEKWNTNIDGGLKFRTGVDPFGRVRIRRSIPLDEWLMRLTERVMWIYGEGWTSESSIAAERHLTDAIFFRAEGKMTWEQELDGLRFDEVLSLSTRIDERRALLLEGSIYSVTKPAVIVEEYQVSVRYRKQFYKDWLYYEIEPRALFPNDRDYKFTPSVVFLVEMIFGDI